MDEVELKSAVALIEATERFCEQQETLERFARLFSGCNIAFEQLPREQHEAVSAAVRKRYETMIDPPPDRERFIASVVDSKRADWLLMRHLTERGYLTVGNDEQVTREFAWDFGVHVPSRDSVDPRDSTFVRIETKHQPDSKQQVISFKRSLLSEQCFLRWRSYDLLLAWQVQDGVLKPWALVKSALFASSFRDLVWTPRSAGAVMNVTRESPLDLIRRGVRLLHDTDDKAAR